MMKRLSLLAFWVAFGAAHGQSGVVSGVVRTSKGVVAGARVVLDSARETRTDSAGRYSLDQIRPGTHWLEALRVGATRQATQVTVLAGRTVSADFMLEDAVPLDSML